MDETNSKTTDHHTVIIKDSAYFSVSPFKLAIMSICTGGFYNLYWIYKNWVHIKEQLLLDINPAWRTIFSFIWIYFLFDLIQDKANKGNIESSIYPGTMTVLYILFGVSSWLPDPYWLLCLFSFMVLIPANNVITKINQKLYKNSEQNKNITGLNWLAIVVGGLLIFSTIFGDFLSIPN